MLKKRKNFSILPPEALKGYTFGKSLKTNSSLQFLLNKSLSFNLNLNTINDARYRNAITMQGEYSCIFLALLSFFSTVICL